MEECKFCGNELRPEDKKCPACGGDVPVRREEPHYSKAPPKPAAKKMSKNRIGLIVIGTIFLLVSLFLFTGTEEPDVSTVTSASVGLVIGISSIIRGIKSKK